MVNKEDLWIGDLLQIISTGEVGKYDGHAGEQIIVNTPGGIRHCEAADLQEYVEPIIEDKLVFDDDPSTRKMLNFKDMPKSIDLHIQKLSPSHTHAIPERILAVQLEALNQYLDEATLAGLRYVTIIHGKGTGVLKAETIHILKGRENVKHWIEVHQGGAMEVLLMRTYE